MLALCGIIVLAIGFSAESLVLMAVGGYLCYIGC